MGAKVLAVLVLVGEGPGAQEEHELAEVGEYGPVGLVLGCRIHEGRPPAAILLLPQLHPRKTSCLPAVVF